MAVDQSSRPEKTATSVLGPGVQERSESRLSPIDRDAELVALRPGGQVLQQPVQAPSNPSWRLHPEAPLNQSPGSPRVPPGPSLPNTTPRGVNGPPGMQPGTPAEELVISNTTAIGSFLRTPPERGGRLVSTPAFGFERQYTYFSPGMERDPYYKELVNQPGAIVILRGSMTRGQTEVLVDYMMKHTGGVPVPNKPPPAPTPSETRLSSRESPPTTPSRPESRPTPTPESRTAPSLPPSPKPAPVPSVAPIAPEFDADRSMLDYSRQSAEQMSAEYQQKISAAWNSATQRFPLGREYTTQPRPTIRMTVEDMDRNGKPDYVSTQSIYDATSEVYQRALVDVKRFNQNRENEAKGLGAVVFNREIQVGKYETVNVPTVYKGPLTEIARLAEPGRGPQGEYTSPRISYTDLMNAGIQNRVESAQRMSEMQTKLDRIESLAEKHPMRLAGATTRPGESLDAKPQHSYYLEAIDDARASTSLRAIQSNRQSSDRTTRTFVVDQNVTVDGVTESVPRLVTLTRTQAREWSDKGYLASTNFSMSGLSTQWLAEKPRGSTTDQPKPENKPQLPPDLERLIGDDGMEGLKERWGLPEIPTMNQINQAYRAAGASTDGIGSELMRIMRSGGGMERIPPGGGNGNRVTATSPDDGDPRETLTQTPDQVQQIGEAKRRAQEVDTLVRPVLTQIIEAKEIPSQEERRQFIRELREIANNPSIDKGYSVGNASIDDLAKTHAHRDRNFIQAVSGPLQLMERTQDPAKQRELFTRAQVAASAWNEYRDGKPLQYERVLRQNEPGFMEAQLKQDMAFHGVKVTVEGDLTTRLPGYDPMSMSLLYEELAGANPSKYRDPSRPPQVRITIERDRITIQDNAIPYPAGEWSPTDGRRYSPEGTTGGGTGLSGLLQKLERMNPPYTLSFRQDNTPTSLGGNILVIEPRGERVAVSEPAEAVTTPKPTQRISTPTAQPRTQSPSREDLTVDERLDQLKPEELNQLKEQFNIPASISDPQLIKAMLLFKDPSALQEALDKIEEQGR